MGFLHSQLSSYVALAAIKASKNGHGAEQLRSAYQLWEECKDGTEPTPLESFAKITPKVRQFIPTGIISLDNQILGLAQEEFGVIAAAPGRGKSCMLIKIAVSSLLAGRGVHYITVADAGKDELVPRIDSCILQQPCTNPQDQEFLQQRHREAIQKLRGHLWISDFTNQSCSMYDIERAIASCTADLVIVDHADDIAPPTADLMATRHSLRFIYLSLKRLSVQYSTAIWTASQTAEQAWRMASASIQDLAECKTGKATAAAVVLVLSMGENEQSITCTIAKARRHYSQRSVPLHIDYLTNQIW